MKLLKAIINWYKSTWYECPKERKGYTCHHREGECGLDDHK